MGKIDTKKKLFDTAMTLFRTKGYDRVSIAEICSSAGTTRNAFYYHYKSKEDLLSSYFQYITLPDDFMEELLKQPDDWEKLLYLIEVHVQLVVQEGKEIAKLLSVASLLADKGLLDNYDLANMVLTLIHQSKAAGLITAAPCSEVLCYMAVRLTISTVQDWTISKDDYDVTQDVKRLLTCLLRPERSGDQTL